MLDKKNISDGSPSAAQVELPSGRKRVPAVSIGMPVYNGAEFIRKSLNSLLAQTFSDFELIISDNASSDDTAAICQEYVAKDQRIRYVRQPANIGPIANFKFVLDNAQGEFFMWSACDDIRSHDFIDVNYKFLVKNLDYVASTSPTGFEGQRLVDEDFVVFALNGDVYSRFKEFFNHCWTSHGIFYCLVRTDILRDCEVIGESFIAFDWAVDLYLAKRGKINRTPVGYTIFGIKGASSGSEAYKKFRNSSIELIVPFLRLSQYTIKLTNSFPIRQRAKILIILFKLNLLAIYSQLRLAFGSSHRKSEPSS